MHTTTFIASSFSRTTHHRSTPICNLDTGPPAYPRSFAFSSQIGKMEGVSPTPFPSSIAPTTSPTDQGDHNDEDGFYSFLCWYLFFLSCCVFPTIWLIRKRFLADTSTVHCVHFDRDEETGEVVPRLEEVGDGEAGDPNNVILWAGYNDDKYNIILTKLDNEQAFLDYLDQYRSVNHQKMLSFLGQCSMVSGSLSGGIVPTLPTHSITCNTTREVHIPICS